MIRIHKTVIFFEAEWKSLLINCLTRNVKLEILSVSEWKELFYNLNWLFIKEECTWFTSINFKPDQQCGRYRRFFSLSVFSTCFKFYFVVFGSEIRSHSICVNLQINLIFSRNPAREECRMWWMNNSSEAKEYCGQQMREEKNCGYPKSID